MSKRGLIGLGPELEKRLAAYATAGAAVLGIGPTPAQGEVVYTKVRTLCNPGADIDLNHDGIVDFSVLTFRGSSSNQFLENMYVQPASGNGFAYQTYFFSGLGVAKALDFGSEIGPSLNFAGVHGDMAGLISTITNGGAIIANSAGPFANVQNKFLRLKLLVGGQIHYSWARIDTKLTIGDFHGTIGCGVVDYAYEKVPNKPINAGQGIKTGSQPDALGWMAVGAEGLQMLGSKPGH